MRLRCIDCGCICTNEIPDTTIFRGGAICPECLDKSNNLMLAINYDMILKVLKEIKDFGFANSGKGYSCAKMAEKAVMKYEVTVDN